MSDDTTDGSRPDNATDPTADDSDSETAQSRASTADAPVVDAADPATTDTAPAYRAIALPEDTPPAEWTAAQRRAYLLAELERVGHPFALDQRALAAQFDVAPATIDDDFGRLAAAMSDRSDSRRDLLTELVFHHAIRALQADSRPYDAAKVLEMWTEWVFDRGKQERAPETRELNIQTETDAIRVLTPAGDDLTEAGEW